MRILKRIGIALLGVILILAVLAGGGYLWALMSTDTSLAARGIIWGGSKYDDWKRFPSRVVRASDTPLYFRVEETDLFDVCEQSSTGYHNADTAHPGPPSAQR